MIIVDQALERREAEGRPIRVALVGAGFMGRGVANQIINSTMDAAGGEREPNPDRGRKATTARTAHPCAWRDARAVDRRSPMALPPSPPNTAPCSRPARWTRSSRRPDGRGRVQCHLRRSTGQAMVTMNAEVDARWAEQHRMAQTPVVLTARRRPARGTAQTGAVSFGASAGPLVCGKIRARATSTGSPHPARVRERWGRTRTW